MTTGNITRGTIGVQNVSGRALTVRSNYGVRNWSGTDYPTTKPTYTMLNLSYMKEVIRVKRGQVYVTMKYKPRFVWIKNRPPKRARIVEHAYTMSDQIVNDQVTWYRNPPPYENVWYPSVAQSNFSQPEVAYGWTSNHDLALLGKLREKVAGSDFNAGVFLGEGHQALSMIGNAATRIAKALRYARKGNFSGAASALTKGTNRYVPPRRVGASNWLELQYGWLPLLMDAKNGAEFLAHQMNVPLEHVVRVSTSLNGKITNGWSPAYYKSTRCYTRKSIKATLREKDVIALSGLTDPLSVAWELLPYSFIIDWFIPIGNYLSARGLSQSLSGTFVTSTKQYEEMKGLAIKPERKDWEFGAGADVYSHRKVTFSRSISTTLPVPRPSVKPLSQVVSWKRAANAVALLSQRFR